MKACFWFFADLSISKTKQRVCVKLWFETARICDLLKTAFGDKFLGQSNVFIRFNKFKTGSESVGDGPRYDTPPTKSSREISIYCALIVYLN